MVLAIDRGSTDVELIDDTIDNILHRTVERFGAREALVVPHQGIRQTWSEFNATIDAVAKGLMASGIAAGDRVGMWSPNFAEWVYIQFATAKIGAIQVNINPAYRTSELSYALNQSGVKLLVTRTSYQTSEYQQMVEEVASDVPGLERTVYFDTDDWAELLAAGEQVSDNALAERAASLLPDDAINIQYTSSTTGFPKGATLSHRNILNNANFVGLKCAYDETDRVCIPVPFYHCFGMVMGNLACAVYGSTMVIPCPTFDPETGEIVERGESGEYCTRGPHVMLGYWDDEERTASAIDADGWMHSGDLATMDENGYVNIVGRIKDMIIRGGENIYPREIEEFLYTHPAIADAQVIGVPDEKYGEQIAAWIQLDDGASLTEEELQEWCRGKIAHFKVPRYVMFVDSFPMTVTGKIRKVEMREKSIADLGLAGVVVDTA